jgi:hypothetical protein
MRHALETTAISFAMMTACHWPMVSQSRNRSPFNQKPENKTMAKFICPTCDTETEVDRIAVNDDALVRRVYRMIAAGEDKLETLREFYALFIGQGLFDGIQGTPPLHMPETEMRLAEAYAKEAAHG